MSRGRVDAVLFDLDGTLVDTAPDFIAALNRLRAELGFEPVPGSRVRPFVSKGAAAMLRNAIPERPDAETVLLQRYLDLYGERVCVLSALYEGVPAVLDEVERAGTPWGIVTNKPAFLTGPLLAALGLDRRAAVVVSGDTLPTRKPDPAPVFHACRVMGVEPARTVMVGDDERDIQAAHAAGAIAALAEWGYIGDEETSTAWGAEHRALRPLDLLRFLP